MRCFIYISFCLLANFGLFAQTEQLAQNYLDQGEYEKALNTYRDLFKENSGNFNFFFGMITSYQQLEDFQSAEALLLEKLNNSSNSPIILIELGHNSELQKKTDLAKKYYEQALEALEAKPIHTYSIAQGFEKYSLLEYAARAYQIGIRFTPEMKYELPLARIYGEQGRLEEMFRSYLDLIDKDPEIRLNLIREFERYLREDASNPANLVFRKLLLQRIQQNQGLIYNELLGWLFVQQREFDKAFAQEKAIYRRNNQDLQPIIQLTVITRAGGDIKTAKEILSFIIEESPSENILLQANQLLMAMEIDTAEKSNYGAIDKAFQGLFQQFGTSMGTLQLQLDYANFLAFKLGKIQPALDLLQELSGKTTTNFELAGVKMLLADILVLDQKFNQALIYYSQVQNLVKNSEVAQDARFKVAKTSYYKGDFEWSKNQLDILKASATQLIANDAMELSLLIQENAWEDSTQTALKLYARADLLSFQNKNREAIAVLEEILSKHKGEKIEDDALLKQAGLFEAEGNWQKAEENYLKILQFYSKDVLSDNATFLLAELYNNKLHQPEKARDFYEKIIFNHPDSIYFVTARKRYRMLRGDTIE